MEVNTSDFNNTVIILNAPPNAEKDTVADALAEEIGVQHSRFKEHLYQVTAVLFNMDVATLRGLASDRDAKDVPHPSLVLELSAFRKLRAVLKTSDFRPEPICISPREALIFASEVVVKPTMGEDYFGNVFASNINIETGTVASDGGFEDEIYPCIERVGRENVFIVQFTRKGVNSFDGDSRDWVNIKGVPSLKTTNNATVENIIGDIIEFITLIKASRGPRSMKTNVEAKCQK